MVFPTNLCSHRAIAHVVKTPFLLAEYVSSLHEITVQVYILVKDCMHYVVKLLKQLKPCDIEKLNNIQNVA